jgi:hypothetical protein
LLEAVASERLEKTKQAVKGVAGVLVIGDMCRLAVAL